MQPGDVLMLYPDPMLLCLLKKTLPTPPKNKTGFSGDVGESKKLMSAQGAKNGT
jgi:hypothetical protein